MLSLLAMFCLYSLGDEPTLGAESCFVLGSMKGKSRLAVAPSLAREVVLVPDSFTDADTEPLGIALHADISKDGAKWKVSRSARAENELRKADAGWIALQAGIAAGRVRSGASRFADSASSGVAETLRKSQAEFESQRAGRVDFGAFQALELTPAGRLLADCLGRLSAKDWASCAPESVTVFSNKPVSEELPLEIGPSVDVYRVAQQKFADWGQGAPNDEVPDKYRWILPKKAYVDGERTVLVRVSRVGAAPEFSVTVYDRNDDVESQAVLTARGFAPPPIEPPSTTQLGYAELPLETRAAISCATLGSPRFASEYLDPVTHEPLDMYVRDALLIYGRAKGFGKVIACVPDDLLPLVKNCIEGSKVDLDGVGRAVRQNCEEIPKRDTLIVRPRLTLANEMARIDRTPLQAAYRSASAGKFGIDALLALHSAYAESYEANSFLDMAISQIRDACHLGNTPNWAVPHPVLAMLGDLTARERSALSSSNLVRIQPRDHPVAYRVMSVFASQRLATGNDNASKGPRLGSLDASPTRIFESPRELVLSGGIGTRTLVKRVALGLATVREINRDTGAIKEQKGKGLTLDSEYMPLNLSKLIQGAGLAPQEAVETINKRYRFLWQREKAVGVEVRLGRDRSLGAFVLTEALDSSRTPVTLSNVPGVDVKSMLSPYSG